MGLGDKGGLLTFVGFSSSLFFLFFFCFDKKIFFVCQGFFWFNTYIYFLSFFGSHYLWWFSVSLLRYSSSLLNYTCNASFSFIEKKVLDFLWGDLKKFFFFLHTHADIHIFVFFVHEGPFFFLLIRRMKTLGCDDFSLPFFHSTDFFPGQISGHRHQYVITHTTGLVI